MKAEKTTTLAGLIGVAGIIAMILFRDAFVGSTPGAVFGVILTALTLAATYICVDGIQGLQRQEEEAAQKKQAEQDDKLYDLLQTEVSVLTDFITGANGKMLRQMESATRTIVTQSSKQMEDAIKIAAKSIVKDLEKSAGKNSGKTNASDKAAQQEQLQEMQKAQREEMQKMETSINAKTQERITQMETAIREATMQTVKEMEVSMQEATAQTVKQMGETVNETTMKAAKLMVQFTKKTAAETKERIDALEQELFEWDEE